MPCETGEMAKVRSNLKKVAKKLAPRIALADGRRERLPVPAESIAFTQ
jgi:hypothetical protein